MSTRCSACFQLCPRGQRYCYRCRSPRGVFERTYDTTSVTVDMATGDEDALCEAGFAYPADLEAECEKD